MPILGKFDTFDAALNAIRNDMEARGFWPNVWYVNDHGNRDLLALEPDGYRIVAGYV